MSPSRAAPSWVWEIYKLLDEQRLPTNSPGWDLFLVLTGPWYGVEPWGEATDTEARARVSEAIDLWCKVHPSDGEAFRGLLVDNRLWPLPPRGPQQLLGAVVAEPGSLL